MTSFPLGRVKGIPLRAHWSLFLILPLIAWVFGERIRLAAVQAEVPPAGLVGPPWAWGLLVAVALFASVLVHELAHSLVAIRKGGKVRDITLMMIGGMSRLEEAPRRPRHEAWMAFAGPLTSLVLGGVALAAHALLLGSANFNFQFAFFYVGALNIFLGVFNLLPAFPMDGGRIARALLTPKLGRVRATKAAGTLGKVFAGLFILAGAFSFNFLLLIIGVFVYMGAAGEQQQVMTEEALGGLKVCDVMVAPSAPVSGSTPLSEVAQRMKEDKVLSVLLLDDAGTPVSIVTAGAVRSVPAGQRDQTPASAVSKKVEAIPADADVSAALRTLYIQRVPEAPVVRDGEFVGVLRQSDVARLLELRELERGGKHIEA